MKATLAGLAILALILVGLGMLTTIVATHPWLANGYLTGLIVTESRVASPRGGGGGGSAPPGVPAEQWPLMVQAGQSSGCGIDPSDLAAVARIESGFGTNVGPNPSSGAFGYGQFMPAPYPGAPDTFHAYGGVGDPNQAANALPVMAKMLCERGYAYNRAQALNSYGGCTTANCMPGGGDYASMVNKFAAQFAPPVAAASQLGDQILNLAGQWASAHVPYLWGGNTMQGVDCSGLVVQVFGAVGINLPRTAATQYAATQRVGPTDVQNGDLIFFHDTDPGDPGIDHVGIVTDAANGLMTHAPEPGKNVQTTSYRSSFYQSHFQGFGRAG